MAELRIGACGALGGAANAWLCYAQLPVAAGNTTFAWHVVPAGAVHGGLLAVIAFGAGRLLSKWTLGARLLAAPLLAWIAGVLSWIPLSRSATEDPWARSLTWPFHQGWKAAIVDPFLCFGLVAGLYYLSVVLFSLRERRLGAHLLYAGLSGALGSLWWWISIEPWYFSPLHGAIWGAFVGTGAWSLSRNGATVGR
jgi:hypothetical protein